MAREMLYESYAIMKIIQIKDKQVLVDDEDYERVSQFNWCINSRGQVLTNCRKFRKNIILLGRFILKVDQLDGKWVDHINRNPLDNRKENLRLCSASHNHFNSAVGTNAKSKYKGVCYYPKTDIYYGKVTYKYTQVNLIQSKSQEECAYSYDFAIRTLKIQFAYLNNVNIENESKRKEIEGYVLMKLLRYKLIQ